MSFGQPRSKASTPAYRAGWELAFQKKPKKAATPRKKARKKKEG